MLFWKKREFWFYLSQLLLFIGFFAKSRAQCLDRAHFYGQFQSILEKELPLQKFPLKKWQKQWKVCYDIHDSLYIQADLQTALSHYANQEYNTAIQISTKTIPLFNALSPKINPADLSKAYYRLGVYYNANDQIDLAINALNSSVKTGHELMSGKIWVAQALVYLTYCYFAKGDYEHAISEANQGIILAMEIKDEIGISKLLQQKAQALNRLERYEEAKISVEKAINIIKKFPEQHISLSTQYRLLGYIYRDLNLPSKGIVYLLKAYEIAKKNKSSLLSDYANSVGFFYYKMNDFKKAIYYYQEALNINKTTYNKGTLFNNIALVYASQKQFNNSFPYFQKGIESFLPSSFIPANIQSLPLAKAIILVAQKNYLLTLIQDKADTWLDYYKATNTKSHLTNALKTYALADSMIDFMRYEHVGEGSKLFWRQKTRGMYERAIEASYLAGDTEAAFRFFEKSKAVLLSDKLNELGANQQLTESSAKRQRTLRDSIANLQNQLASLPANDAKRSGIQRRLEQFNDDFEAFRKQLESTNTAYYRYKYDNSTPNIAEFQKSISANEPGARTVGFVSYFVGDSAIYAFCLDQKARLVRLSLRPSDYQSLANEFLSLCADRSRLNAHYPQYRVLAHRLYQLLWKPLGMTASRVIISQDGVFLPFETLLVQPNQNDFLLKHHAISYTYSANFLAKNQTDLAPSLRQGNKLFHRSFVGFAPETFQPSLRQASLKGSVAALDAVEEKFWWGKTLKNNEATKAQFMRYAPHSRVIQLFTHADADSTEAVEPRIYFHDAALRLSELTQADRFTAQLMVLSACKTGVGQNQRGEGVFSLARGFAALGIPSTITTLWSVEDQPTYELTKLFYNYLDQGLPKDEALQRAKLDWLNQGDAADALPSQWAGMILVGDTAPLVMEGLQFIVLGLGLLGLGVLGGVWWWRKHASLSSTAKMSRFYNHSKKG